MAMVHCNNCTSELNAWAEFVQSALNLFGVKASTGDVLSALFNSSVNSQTDCGGITAIGFISGEPIVGLPEGRPLLVRSSDGRMTVENLMKAEIYSAVAPLAIGMNILKSEGVSVNSICGHGGFFKTKEVGQRAVSAALSTSVTVLDNAGEGGAWGIALLASYVGKHCSLEEFLDGIFADVKSSALTATEEEIKQFDKYFARYKRCLAVERNATEVM